MPKWLKNFRTFLTIEID